LIRYVTVTVVVRHIQRYEYKEQEDAQSTDENCIHMQSHVFACKVKIQHSRSDQDNSYYKRVKS